jgi:RNA polymerase sigma factor (sigma-70 family)
MVSTNEATKEECAIIERYTQLIRGLAYKYKSYAPEYDFEVLEQEAKIAMLRAIRMYDDSKGELVSYAYMLIKTALRDCVCRINHPMTTAISPSFKKAFFDIRARGFDASNDECVKEVSKRTGMNAIDIIQITAPCVRLDADDNAALIEDSLAENVEENIDKKRIVGLISSLPEKYQYVIRQLFYEDRTLKEVGDELGVSGARIGQIRDKALNRMRAAIK